MINSGRAKLIHLVLIIVLLGALGFLALVWRDAGESVPGLPPLANDMAQPPVQPSASVEIYLVNNNLDPAVTCTKVFPVTRIVSPGTDSLRGTLEALLAGPTAAEIDQGYGSILPRNLTVNRLDRLNGTVFVDFGPELAKLAGSCAVSFARAEIEQTLAAFASASTSVVISVNGNADEALQP